MGDLTSSHPAEPQSALLAPPQSTAEADSADTVGLNGDEEPYTIKCICGFAEDDGNTVLCEQCNTWQHIECYYPGAIVPDVHTCVDCSPRALDATGATLRQRRLRDSLKLPDDRKSKRAGHRSHKKTKTKDLNNIAIHTNGWSAPERPDNVSAVDRKRNSPKYQQPPAKRPKTTHRNSTSLLPYPQDLARPNHHRQRSSSNQAAALGHLTASIPDLPPDFFSPEFIRVHQFNTSYVPAQTNLYLDIGVTNLLSRCLMDSNEFAAATNGRSALDYLKRSPQPIEELFAPIRREVHEDLVHQFHGSHPKWPYLIVERDVVHNSLIGEIRGHIGHWDSYKQDPANRWSTLRHPDHFVFFHPALPIYIDARSEGTEMRYARRSCRPNSRMETIITEEREYRFCFIATTDLQAGDEVTIGWNIELHQELFDCLSRVSSTSATDAEREYLSGWVEGLLAHFGGCACIDTTGQECLMARFDRRLSNRNFAGNGITRPASRSRTRKTKKRSSPGDGRADTSRANSEVLVRGEVDEENDDARSTTQSSKSRNSRDASPSIHNPNEARDAALSERDKRKLMQQEKLFEQLAHEEQHGQRRKKRNSGSNANTPSIASSKQLGHSPPIYHNTIPAQVDPLRTSLSYNALSGLNSSDSPGSRSTNPKKPSLGLKEREVKVHRKNGTNYIDCSTQTSIDNNTAVIPNPAIKRKAYVSLTQRLLKRAHLAKLPVGNANDVVSVKFSPSSPTPRQGSTENEEDLSLKSAESTGIAASHPSSMPTSVAGPDLPGVMGPVSTSPFSAPVTSTSQIGVGITQAPLQPSHPPTKPPPPPWLATEQSDSPEMTNVHIPPSERAKGTHRGAELHVDLPPRPIFSNGETMPSAGSGSLPTPLTHSPLTTDTGTWQSSTQMLSPAAINSSSITQQSPIKKKMSLSDYMNKKKVETPIVEKTQRQSQAQIQSISNSNSGLKVDEQLHHDAAGRSPVEVEKGMDVEGANLGDVAPSALTT